MRDVISGNTGHLKVFQRLFKEHLKSKNTQDATVNKLIQLVYILLQSAVLYHPETKGAQATFILSVLGFIQQYCTDGWITCLLDRAVTSMFTPGLILEPIVQALQMKHMWNMTQCYK